MPALTLGRLHRVSPEQEISFFGYYNISPWSADEKYLLYHTLSPDKLTCDLVVAAADGETVWRGRTDVWHPQQGTLAQWLDDGTFVHNAKAPSGECIAIQRRPDGTVARVLPRPVGAVSAASGNALSLNYGRIRYGYGNVKDPHAESTAAVADGIHLIHGSTLEVEQLVSTRDCAVEVDPDLASFHALEHVDFAPNGEDFLFIHRWTTAEGHVLSRLGTWTRGGSTAFYGGLSAPSHYAWLDNRRILVWARLSRAAMRAESTRGALGRALRRGWGALRPLLGPAWRSRMLSEAFFVLDVDSGDIQMSQLGLHIDGHPAVHPDRGILIDSYPDPTRMRNLYWAMTPESKAEQMLSLPTLHLDGLFRSDLHPRWSPSGNRICIDSDHSGCRSVYVADVTFDHGGESRRSS